MWTTSVRKTIFIWNMKSRLTETVIASTEPSQAETRQILSTEKGKWTKVPLLNKKFLAVDTCIQRKINFILWTATEYINHFRIGTMPKNTWPKKESPWFFLCVHFCIDLVWIFVFGYLVWFTVLFFEKKIMLFGG